MSDWEVVDEAPAPHHDSDWEVVPPNEEEAQTGSKWGRFLAEKALKSSVSNPADFAHLVGGNIYNPALMPEEYEQMGLNNSMPPSQILQSAVKNGAGIDITSQGEGNTPAQRVAGHAMEWGLNPLNFAATAAKKGASMAAQVAKNAATTGSIGAGSGILRENGVNPIAADLLAAGAGIMAPGAYAQAAKAAAPAVNAIKNIDITPSGLIAKYSSNKLSLPELAANLRAARGTNTPLGDVIGSPTIKKAYENTIAPSAFSGAEETMGNVANQVQDRAENLIHEKLGKTFSGEDANPLVKELLDKAYASHNEIKNNLYNKVNEMAAAENIPLELPSFKRLARENARAIQSSPMLKNDADFKKTYNNLTGLKNTSETVTHASDVLDQYGSPILTSETHTSSIADAKIIANKLYSTGRDMLKSSNAVDRQQGALYKRLGTSIRNDVKTLIKKHGSPEIQNEYAAAENYYKDAFSQFLDKDLYKMIEDGKDPQTIIREIIKPGKSNDKYTLIEKVQKVLPPEQQNLLGYNYLRGAINQEGVLNPQALDQLIKSLGKRQFRSLFPDKETRGAILDFSRIKNMNNEALNYMFNPKNGSRNTELLKQIAGVFPAALGYGAGHGAFGPIGGLLGITAATAAKGKSANYLNRMITSENFREKVVNKKIAHRERTDRHR